MEFEGDEPEPPSVCLVLLKTLSREEIGRWSAWALLHAAANCYDLGFDLELREADAEQLDKLDLLLRFEADQHGLQVFDVHNADGYLVALSFAPTPRRWYRPYVEHLPMLGAYDR